MAPQARIYEQHNQNLVLMREWEEDEGEEGQEEERKRAQSWEGTEKIWEVDLGGTGELGGRMRGKCDQNKL